MKVIKFCESCGQSLRSDFSLNLEKIRKEKGITQKDLSKLMGVTRSAVAMWETSKADPGINTLIELCKVFEIEPNELLKLKEAATSQ